MLLSKKNAVLVILSALWLSGCDAPEQVAPPAPPAPEVAVVRLHSETVTLTSELPGRVVAAETSEVRPQVNGVIRKRLFEEGGLVEAGQILYEIEDAPYQAALGTAQGALARAEAAIDATRRKADRFEQLGTLSAISQQEIDNAIAEADQAAADVVAQRAAVEAATVNLDFTRIRAPISGRIGRSLVTPGALVQAGQPEALAVIQQTETVYVDITQSASDVLNLRQAVRDGLISRDADGTPVELLLPNGTTYAEEGRLEFSEVTVNPATGAVTLRATFPNAEDTLLPGMYVRARLIDGVQQEAILAPQRGISRDNRGRPIAMVVNGDNVVERRNVVTERAVGDRWLVTDGLQAGDQLIVEGLHRIAPGVTVVATPWQENAAPAESNAAQGD